MTPTKSELRAQARLRRAGRVSEPPTPDLLKFIQTELKPHSAIGCYISRFDELDTASLIQTLMPSFNVFGPAVSGENLIWRKIDGNFVSGNFGIKEPTSMQTISVESLSCILIPALAIDQFGNRLGFGAGYFDKNLASASAIKIGLVFDEDIIAEIPSESHDVKLNYIATESRIIKIDN